MSQQEAIYKWHRFVMVRFLRCITGAPDAGKPDVDDRGFAAPEHGPVVGLVQGSDITVRLTRERIDSAAALFVTSTDKSIVTVTSPASGALPATTDMDIGLHGVRGGPGAPVIAKIEVRFGSATGPIIHQLTVWAFQALNVALTPHMVTISDSTGASVGSVANVNDIMKLVAAIWKPCGVNIAIQPAQNDAVTFATAGVVSDNPFPGELNTMTSTNWIPRTINAYFVNQIGTGNTLGYGFSRASASTFGLTNPGIILGDTTAGGVVRDTFFWANDLAHEVGHFFRLWHPENLQPPNEREDTWSRRMLMHNFNLMRGHNPWPARDASGTAYKFRPLLDDIGYGPNRRGCLVTMKHLSQLTTDGECTTARGTINSAAGPY